MKAKARELRVVLELDESGHWIATVPSVKGCHSYGRSIHEAMENISEALDLFDSNPARTLRPDIRLNARARRVIAHQRDVLLRAERARTRAAEATSSAVTYLTHDVRLSLRDVGEILGLSHQRIQQIQRERRRAAANRIVAASREP